jgi:hypothetical protein
MENYSLEMKYSTIEEIALSSSSADPIEIALNMMKEKGISMHGPEHHFLDGAAFLSAYKNAGGDIDLKKDLEELRKRSLLMPGAMCGYWGVCGSVSSVGSALSIIHSVSPISDSQYYKDDMEFSSLVLNKMSSIGGPRCCKRNAFLSLSIGASFVKEKYGINMKLPKTIGCEFAKENNQCIFSRCPFFAKKTVL